MIKLDLLFTDAKKATLNPGFYLDMGLGCLKKVLNDSEYNVFLDTIYSPLIDVDLIIERQKILKDFLDYPELLNDMQKICMEAQNNTFVVHDFVYSRVTPKRKLIENLQVLNRSLEVPDKFLSAMQNKVFSSKILFEFYNNLDKTVLLKEIKQKINEISGWLVSDCVSFDISNSNGLKFKSSLIAAKGSNIIHKKIRFKKQEKDFADTYEFSYDSDYILNLQVENLIERGVKNMCSIISSVNSYVLSFTKRLLQQLCFYSAASKIIKFGNRLGCPTCFPHFQSKTINAKSLYDIGLLVLKTSISKKVPNDFFEEENVFYLISGVNQGGKTTFLKSIGVAQLFAQNGLPVWGKEYDCPTYQSLVCHFTKEEALLQGKLAEELMRFHDLLPLMKDNALILLNESFSTTTEIEGYEIASDVLKALSRVHPTLLFVTHNYRLLNNIIEVDKMLEGNVHLRSLIVKNEKSSTDRTYAIIPGKPQEEIGGLEYLLQSVIKK